MTGNLPNTLAAAVAIAGSTLLTPQPAHAQDDERTQANQGAAQPGWERQADRYRSFGDASDGIGAAVERQLREAVQAMARQPPGERRNRAMDRAREALLETQQAMVQLPADLGTR
jgi:hypothetical protein